MKIDLDALYQTILLKDKFNPAKGCRQRRGFSSPTERLFSRKGFSLHCKDLDTLYRTILLKDKFNPAKGRRRRSGFSSPTERLFSRKGFSLHCKREKLFCSPSTFWRQLLIFKTSSWLEVQGGIWRMKEMIVMDGMRLLLQQEFKPEEITAIMNDFAEPGTLAPTGLYLRGTKIYGDPRKSRGCHKRKEASHNLCWCYCWAIYCWRTLGSINQLFICVGILAALVAGLPLAGNPLWWRTMFGIAIIPSVLLAFGTRNGIFSRKPYVEQGKFSEAEMAIKRLFEKKRVAEVMNDFSPASQGSS